MAEQIPHQVPGVRPRFWAAIRAVLRTRIVAGLLTVIPIWVTYVVVRFVFDMMRSATEPLAQRVADIVIEQNRHLVPAVVRSYFAHWVVPILAVLLTLFFLYALGLLTANVFGRQLLHMFERVFEKVPMVKTIYRSTKQIVMSIGGQDAMRFHRVVLIEVPRPGMKRIAFLTSVMTDADTGRQLANIFIPYTPYVTTGYMQIVPMDEVFETNWTVEEAVKLVMSGGILSPTSIPFEHPRPVQWGRPEGEAALPPAGGAADHAGPHPPGTRN